MNADETIADFLSTEESSPTTETTERQGAAAEQSSDDQVTDFLEGEDVEPESSEVEKAATRGNEAAKQLQEEKEEKEEKGKQPSPQGKKSNKKKEPTISAVGKTAGNLAGRLSDWLASRPTPGGIWPLLLALFFFLWVIVPVNRDGDTRASLLWGILTGQVGWSTELLPDVHDAPGGAGGDFGNGGVSPAVVAIMPVMPLYAPDFGVY